MAGCTSAGRRTCSASARRGRNKVGALVVGGRKPSNPARQRLTRKGFLPDFGELGRELVLGNPVRQVAHVQVSPVNLQQHPNIGSVEDTPGEQLVDDQIFTA